MCVCSQHGAQHRLRDLTCETWKTLLWFFTHDHRITVFISSISHICNDQYIQKSAVQSVVYFLTLLYLVIYTCVSHTLYAMFYMQQVKTVHGRDAERGVRMIRIFHIWLKLLFFILNKKKITSSVMIDVHKASLFAQDMLLCVQSNMLDKISLLWS